MNQITAAGATFVQVSRDELEAWLDAIGFHGKWERDQRYQGVYLLKLAPSVAVKLSSTIGSKDDAMGVGKASMQLALVSTVTGRTLNKKAQGQSHFKRTVGWKKTWAAGVDTMKKAYLASSDFYDAIAEIADRDAYKDDLLIGIEKIPGWENDRELLSFYRKVERGGVLMPRELAAVKEAMARPLPKTPDPQRIEPGPAKAEGGFTYDPASIEITKELRIDALRKLWVLAKRGDDAWTMQFAQDIAQKYVAQGRRLSGPQLHIVSEKLKSYRIIDSNGKPAQELF